MSAVSIARTALRRFFRDRSNFFFVFVLPIALIILIGAQFGGGFRPTVGIVAGSGDLLTDSIVAEIEAIPEYEVRRFDDEDELVTAVSRGGVSAGVVIPAGLTRQVAGGETPEVGFVTRPDNFGPAVRAAVQGAFIEALGPATAARTVAEQTGVAFDAALAATTGLAGQVADVTVTTRTTGEALFPETLGQFDLGASSQLVLFMFLTGLTGSAALIQSRQLGVTTRMLSTPTTTRSIITGEALGRLAVTVFQGIYIALVTYLAFQVDWGDLLGTIAIMLAFGLVGAGAAMLVGAVFRNDQQAGGISVVIGLGLAALGGSMAPIEVFSPAMQTVARFTPHAWANDAFAELVRREGNLLDILPQLGVLLAIGIVLLALAAWRLRRVISVR